ncbi:hypothetical protein C8J57DRAFT_1217566 [Mycena rebaudengoi]|nr:hypothetical protein C8J57DRAFT_1217566 [Mycena rebaudengoi]
MSSVTELKAQGDALFIAKDFKQAAQKYTAAIAAGDEAADPKSMAPLQTTRLDPTFAKGFARLATAEDVAGPKEQYQAALKLADAKVEKMKNTNTVGGPSLFEVTGAFLGNLPTLLSPISGSKFHEGSPVLKKLLLVAYATGSITAWVIHGAHKEFMDGIQSVNSLKLDPVTGVFMSRLDGLTSLTNSILRDGRIMHFPDTDFISKYDEQGKQTWVEAGPEVVINEALARQRTEGWNSVRPAISVTVRAWIMRGVIEGGMREKHDVAVELFKRSLEVLRSLSESWLLVSKDNRGAVFEKTFIFGVQRLCTEQSWRGQKDPGFVSSFYIYSRGMAYA